MLNINETIESLACMNKSEREQFVEGLVERFPNLANDLMHDIQVVIFDREYVFKDTHPH
jgi:hypothetical protein